MGYIDPRYLEHQAKRFIRQDWKRYMRPDWRDRKYWVGEPPEHPFGLPAQASQPTRKLAPPPSAEEIEAAERERRAIEWNMAALRLQRAWLQLGLQQQKAYNPNQARVPAGNPDGGQWTDSGTSGGTSTDFSSARRLGSKPDGHHFVPHSIYTKMPLSDEARKVFDEAKTGRQRWFRLSEQIFRIDKWSVYQG